MRIDDFRAAINGVKKEGDAFVGLCPAHDDKSPSLRFFIGDNDKIVLKCRAGCATKDVLSKLGLTFKDLDPSSNGSTHKANGKPLGTIVKTYDYVDATGNLRYQSLRYEPKAFRQRRPDGHGGWIYNLGGVQRVLYCLPALLATNEGDQVVIVEGEKDADTLNEADMVAITNAGGAGKFPSDVGRLFQDRHVVIFPDNDEPGRNHAKDVARKLAPYAASVRIVELPGLPEKGDVSDWLAQGHGTCQLQAEIEKAPFVKLGNDSGSAAAKAAVTRMSSVTPKKVDWLWNGRIPLGKITIIDGDPGLGKSCMTLNIAARISIGAGMPDGTLGPLGNVVILSAEDALSDTIQPRLKAAGADLKQIHAITHIQRGQEEHPVTLPDDLDHIEDVVMETAAKLLIIDPFMAYVSGEVNVHRDHDVRRVLHALKNLAERTGAAIIIIRHLNKGNNANAVYRGGGSIGIIGAARSGLLVAKDPDNEELRVLAAVKCNLAAPPVSMSYQLVSAGEAVAVSWLGESRHTAQGMLAIPEDNERKDAATEAAEVLTAILADGPLEAKEAKKRMRDAGVSNNDTISRAKTIAGVKSKKTGFSNPPLWHWVLEPPKRPNTLETGILRDTSPTRPSNNP